MSLNIRHIEPPTGIVERLQQIHPALGLKMVPCCGRDPYWALTWDWPENDPRRARVRDGLLAPDKAWDMLSMLPMGCSAGEAYGYAINAFRRSSDQGIRDLLNDVEKFNQENTAKMWSGTTDEAMNQIEVMGHKMFAKESGVIAKSYGGITAKPKKKGSKK